MGPFELMDLTGLDVTAAVIDSIWHGFRHSDRLRPSYLTPNRVAAGLHGRKTGRGFYDVRPRAPAAAGGAAGHRRTPDRAGARRRGAGDGRRRAAGSAHRRRAPSSRTAPEPSADALVLVPTWGTTRGRRGRRARAARRAHLRRGPALRARRAPRARRDPGRRPGRRAGRAARCWPAAGARRRAARGRRVVRDTAGSVAQRLLASIVSVAASIAERSLATPEPSTWR